MSLLDNISDDNLIRMLRDLLTRKGKPPTRGAKSILYARGARIAKKRGLKC